ncbi:hypothetical protein [Halopseudomonas salegens]|uniref:Uncharacterized protein n=1 Tax=Halopseudomonas salegens TaxID=1434072 RepID=A0A1H2GKM3_9GAMM|nr:hypothetical protein [Halopseudomonas salegens]SDU20001.1 hypothetical protein SAMN05216210_2368 [Halopseudomonas salegens]
MQRWILIFVAGFLAVLCFHQTVAGLLYVLGIFPSAPYSMAPTQPLGVPSVLSSSFWGGLWALVMFLALDRLSARHRWLKALLFGGLALTLVAIVVVFPLKGYSLPLARIPVVFALGFIVNAAWGVGTLLLARLLGVKGAQL